MSSWHWAASGPAQEVFTDIWALLEMGGAEEIVTRAWRSQPSHWSQLTQTCFWLADVRGKVTVCTRHRRPGSGSHSIFLPPPLRSLRAGRHCSGYCRPGTRDGRRYNHGKPKPPKTLKHCLKHWIMIPAQQSCEWHLPIQFYLFCYFLILNLEEELAVSAG